MIPHSGDRPPRWCGVGNRGDVPYVEALAFWGWAVDERLVPRSYALGVLCEHPLMFSHMWWGEPLADRWERLCQTADDLADWENIAVAMAIVEGQDFWVFLQSEWDIQRELSSLPVKIAFCDERLEAEQAPRPAATREDPVNPPTCD